MLRVCAIKKCINLPTEKGLNFYCDKHWKYTKSIGVPVVPKECSNCREKGMTGGQCIRCEHNE